MSIRIGFEAARVGQRRYRAFVEAQVGGRAFPLGAREGGGDDQVLVRNGRVGVGARLIMSQHLFRLQQVVAVNSELVDVALEGVAAQSRLGVVGSDAQIGCHAAVLGGLQIGCIKRCSIGVHSHAIDVGLKDTLPLVVAVAARIAVVGDRFPGESQVLPFTNAVISVGIDIRAAAAHASEHAEVPTVAF